MKKMGRGGGRVIEGGEFDSLGMMHKHIRSPAVDFKHYTIEDKAGASPIGAVEVYSLSPGNNKLSLLVDGGQAGVSPHLIKDRLQHKPIMSMVSTLYLAS